VIWRVGLIDSLGNWPGAADASAFVDYGNAIEHRGTVADPSGHGSAIAGLLTAAAPEFGLLLGQVFVEGGSATGAVVAAAIDWALDRHANLLHLSLGLAANRVVLAAAIGRAVAAGCIVVASTPAWGTPVYPAAYAYPGVIRATGDARCAPGELSRLAPWLFAGCPRFEGSNHVGIRREFLVGLKGISR
jgi:hypothetical protein